MISVGGLDEFDVIGEFRQVIDRTLQAHRFRRAGGRLLPTPVRPEPVLAVRVTETFEEMRGFEIRLDICPALFGEGLEIAQTAHLKHAIDVLACRQSETFAIGNTEAFGEFLDHVEVLAGSFRRINEFRAEQDVLVAAAAVEVVMFEKHGGRQHDIGQFRRLRHELFVDAGEEIVAQETLLDQPLLGRDVHRIGVLDQHGGDRRPAIEFGRIVRQHAPDLGLVHAADRLVLVCRTLDQRLLDTEDAAIGVEGAAALILPRTGDARHGERCMHVGSAVARAGKAVSQSEECPFCPPDQRREGLDFLNGKTGDRRRPFGRPGFQMGLQTARIVSEFFEIGPVGIAVAESHMHDGAGKRTVCAGLKNQRHVRLFHGRRVVDVDDDDLGAAFLARLDRMGHHIDLGGHRVGAPYHHAIGFSHLARIGTAQSAGAHGDAGPGGIDADRAEESGIALGVAQAMDRVALHESHRAGILIGPHGFRAIFFFCGDKFLGDEIERCFPARLLPVPLAAPAGADQRLHQPVGMVDPLGIARDLGADDTGGIGIVGRPADATDLAGTQDFDVQRTSRGAIMGTGRVADPHLGRLTLATDGARFVHCFPIWERHADRQLCG